MTVVIMMIPQSVAVKMLPLQEVGPYNKECIRLIIQPGGKEWGLECRLSLFRITDRLDGGGEKIVGSC